MLLFLKALGTMLAKSQVLVFFSSMGYLAAGLGIFATTIRYALPSAPLSMAFIVMLTGGGLAFLFTANQLSARKAERDMLVAEARMKAAKAERNNTVAKARAQVAEAADDN